MSMFSTIVVVGRDAGALHRLAEPVEVDAQQVDRIDAVLGHRRGMGVVVAPREQTAVHLRMQRLDAAVHHLREPGVVGDLLHFDAGLGDRAPRAAGRQQGEAGFDQTAGEVLDAVLVGYRQQRASHVLASSFLFFR